MTGLKNGFLMVVLLVSFLPGSGQLRFYSNPLKIPVAVSGNFGELRPNHFHTGIDFKTQHRTGIPVHACADGFVSRIQVSPAGYGKLIFVEHPNNTTSAYGHLEKFRDDIAKYVKEEQYLRQSYSVDIKVPARKFEVNRGDMIALSGNSGSSRAPHLHFEIRDTRSGDAFNPLIIDDFSVTDKLPPRIFSVRIVPLNAGSQVNMGRIPKTFLLKTTVNGYQFNPAIPVKALGNLGISFRATDYFDEALNPCGIYEASLIVNGIKIFGYRLSRIPMDEIRYINSHTDYGVYVRTSVFFQKLWSDRGNRLDIYDTGKSRGIINVEAGKEYHCELVVSDVTGNSSRVTFTLSGKAMESKPASESPENMFRYDAKNNYSTGDFEIEAPKGAFYEDFPFIFRESAKVPGFYSALCKIHNSSVPIQKSVNIRILTSGLPDRLRDKAIAVRVDAPGQKQYAGGKMSGDWMETSVLRFGNYAVACDTARPRILSLSIRNNVLTESSAIRFRISDDLSGIQSYNGYIDGHWALFEYDAKYSSLVYRIDRERLGPGKRHTIQLVVEDKVKNSSVFKATFMK